MSDRHINRVRDAGIHYRGWTLVDRGRFRFASKDSKQTVLRRVCRETDNMPEAIRKFRAVVDREEAGR